MKRIITFGIVTLMILGFTTSMIVFAQQDTVAEVKINNQNTEDSEETTSNQEDTYAPELKLAFNTEAIDATVQSEKDQKARLEEEKKEQERLAELKKQQELAAEKARQAQLRTQRTATAPSPAPTQTESQSSTPATPQGDGLDHWSGRLAYWCGVYGCDSAKLTEVIRCESGGNHVANLDKYHKGLFQFLPSTFNANAARLGIAGASVNNGEQQVQVATWMFSQGQAGQWPACSARAGLL